jgi:hypothetical protein
MSVAVHILLVLRCRLLRISNSSIALLFLPSHWHFTIFAIADGKISPYSSVVYDFDTLILQAKAGKCWGDRSSPLPP